MTISNTEALDAPPFHLRVLRTVGGTNLSLLATIVVLSAIVTSQESVFLTRANLVNIGANAVVVGLLALGETFVIVSGMLDISVGSAAAVASVVAALIITNTIDSIGSGAILIGLAGAVAAGMTLGAVNGLIVTKLRVNPIITTLGTLSAYRGLALLIAPDGKPVSVINGTLREIGTGRIFGVPYTLIILLVAAAACHLLLSGTRFGRNTYAMGGNETAARLAGVPTMRLKVQLYMVCGLLVGIAGFVLLARTSSGGPAAGDGLELQAITAVFLGGAVMEGGKGTIAGTTLAVILIGVLSNGMNLVGVPTFYQEVAKGLLLILAVGGNQYREARAARRRVAT